MTAMQLSQIAVQGNFAYSFLLGVLAAVNPCGFVLLPTYLLYFLGLDKSNGLDTQRASLRRALTVSSALSLGFIAVFLIVGTISRLFTQWLELNAKFAGFAIGIGLVLVGLAMLAGWKPPLTTPNLARGRDRTFPAMFLFGIAYAIASIGCTIGFLTTAVFGSIGTHGYLSGVISIGLYGVGMALLVSALTVTLAFAQNGLFGFLRSGLRYIDRLAAVFVVLTGVYLTWFWYLAISESTTSNPILRRVENWQTRLATFLQRQGSPKLAIIFIVIVGFAVTLLVKRQQKSESKQLLK
ncbi:MAG: cytochrome c biogenesis protein CcdA [Ilumatobacteraceae bacterium]